MLKPLLAFAVLVSAVAVRAAEVPVGDDWPEFRGPTGQGLTDARNLPLEWSADRNVRWKQAIPGQGWSSPVTSDGRVYLTTGVLEPGGTATLRALGLEAATGKILWDTVLFTGAEITGPSIHPKSSPASPSPIVADGRIYAHFGYLGTACLDRDGKILWKTREPAYRPVNGNGSSPIIVDDKLIFNADGASAPAVVALAKETGKILWQTPRSARARQTFSFSTPLLITVDGRRQIVSPGSGGVSAYDPNDGREIWHVGYGRGYSVVPRPVFAHGLVFLSSGFDRADLLAIRPNGQGDVTDTHVAWRTTKGAPLTPSLLVLGDELYGVNDAGIATCWDARTGTVHWQEKIEGNYSASPLGAPGRVYFQSENGIGVVIAAGRTFRKLATNDLGEKTFASYVVIGDEFLIRTERHLYRIATLAGRAVGGP